MFGKQHKKVVVRMAPSPTGHLHIGTARTALYNYLFAKKHDGVFILRSEDTDAARCTKAFEEEITEGLSWLGIEWDEYARQSERKEVYTKHLGRLLERNLAYRSKEESKREPGTEVEVIRLRNPNKTITFEDEVRGEISFETAELGDFVIARSVNDVLYHFAVVVDDFEMGVTHVIRGDDHISNTPRQILIQEAIGAERPTYAHLPLLLASDRSKLSKRHGAVALYEYREEGFLPAAMTNYLSLLGWNPGTDQEIFTLEELISEFSLEGIQKGGAIFDREKLRWFNKEHLLRLSNEEFVAFVRTWLPSSIEHLPQFNEERLEKLIPTIRERVSTGKDIVELTGDGEYDFAFKAPDVTADMLKWKNDASSKDALSRLRKIAEIFSTLGDDATFEDMKDPIWEYAEQVGKGEVLWPLRVALTGRQRSPDPFAILYIIGPAEAYKRLQHACDTILKQV